MKTQIRLVMMVAALVSVPLVAFSADENFEKRKAETVNELQERIQKLQDHKNCISAAANADAMKQCHASMQEWRQSEKVEHMEKRKVRMEERIQKMKERHNHNSLPGNPGSH